MFGFASVVPLKKPDHTGKALEKNKVGMIGFEMRDFHGWLTGGHSQELEMDEDMQIFKCDYIF